MPLYEYACKKCGKHVDKIEKVDGPYLRKCPSCGGPVERVTSAPAIQFKGSGWYVTDYGRSSGKEQSGKDAGGKDFGGKDSAGKDGKDAGGQAAAAASSKSDGQSESKPSGSRSNEKAPPPSGERSGERKRTSGKEK